MNGYYWGGAILFIGLSYMSTTRISITIFTIDKSFMAAVFLLIGNLCKPFVQYLVQLKFRWVDVLLITSGIFCILLSERMNSQSVLMYENQYGNYGWFFLGAMGGIIASILICKYLYILLQAKENIFYRLFMWIGFNSLVLFPVHLMVRASICQGLIHFGINFWVVILCIMLLISIPLCNIVTHYLPWMLGEFRKK